METFVQPKITGYRQLTATEAALMRLFAARPGEALSREELVDELGRAEAGRGDGRERVAQRSGRRRRGA